MRRKVESKFQTRRAQRVDNSSVRLYKRNIMGQHSCAVVYLTTLETIY